MRITASAKEATRERILQVAQELFQARGFEQTTSRELAAAAGIAAGTVFNYFASKEAIVLQLMSDLLHAADRLFEKRSRSSATLEEDLFLYVSTGLRQLAPLRTFIAPTLETHLGPASDSAANESGSSIRTLHLNAVTALLNKHGLNAPPTALQLQMYWLLYTGVLAYWSRDSSHKQEQSLALLDQSIKMFVTWIGDNIPSKAN